MKDIAFYIFALGTVGGLITLLQLAVDTFKKLYGIWLRERIRKDFIAACEKHSIDVVLLQVDDDMLEGTMEQGGIPHTFRVGLSQQFQYNKQSMPELVAIIAKAANFDLAEEAE